MAQVSDKRGRGRPPKAPAPTGEKPDLTEKRWRALEREFRGWRGGRNKEDWPSSAPAQFVAEFADVSVQMVFRWRKDPEYLRGLYWLLVERLEQRLARDDQSDSQPIANDEPQSDEIWVEPDPSLFQRDSSPGENLGQREFEMVAEELFEVLGEDALNTAKSRAAEFHRKGTADQRKFWTRMAHAIQELLDRRSNNATKEKAVKN